MTMFFSLWFLIWILYCFVGRAFSFIIQPRDTGKYTGNYSDGTILFQHSKQNVSFSNEQQPITTGTSQFPINEESSKKPKQNIKESKVFRETNFVQLNGTTNHSYADTGTISYPPISNATQVTQVTPIKQKKSSLHEVSDQTNVKCNPENSKLCLHQKKMLNERKLLKNTRILQSVKEIQTISTNKPETIKRDQKSVLGIQDSKSIVSFNIANEVLVNSTDVGSEKTKIENDALKANITEHRSELPQARTYENDQTPSLQSTTLSSLFSENLIPPLPQSWTENDNDEWKYVNQANFTNSEHFDKRDLDDQRQSSHPHTQSNNETGDQSLIAKSVFNSNSDNKTRNSLVPEKFTYATSTVPSLSTIRVAGKAFIEDRKKSAKKEHISFITMPPGRHWYLWGDFAERRKVDPFFDFPDNMTDITQVYTTYWGAGLPGQANKGLLIMKAGTGVAILILVVTITAQTSKFCHPQLSQKAMLTTNLATSFVAAHLVFVFGIQATNGAWACGVVALLLHFLHLLCCNWILALSIRLLRSLLRKKIFPTIGYCIPVWIFSAAIVVGSYIFNPNGYETRRYCWLSIEKGMLVSFIGPVCSLLLINAGICIASQKFLLEEEGYSDQAERFDLKAGVVLLPLEGIAWFLTIVALEDEYSIALDLAAATATVSVSFFTLHLHVPGWRGVYSSLQCRPVVTPVENDPVPLPSSSDPVSESSVDPIPCQCKPDVATLEHCPIEPTLYSDSERGEVY